MNCQPPHAAPRPTRLTGSRGYSLIELMVSIAIGLLIITALLALYANGTSTSKSGQNTLELVNNGRYALESIKTDVRQAGFRGFTWAIPDPPNQPLSTVITPIGNECLEPGAAAGAFVSNHLQGVWGADDNNPFAGGSNCLNGYVRGDVLVVRSLSAIPATTLTAGTFYFRSNYTGGEIFRGSPTAPCDSSLFPPSIYTGAYGKYPCIPGKPGIDLLNFPLVIHVYYIRAYTSASTESPLVPALMRLSLQSDGSMASEVLASGIENLQVQYGQTPSNATTQYYNAGSITHTSNNSTVYSQDWADVSSVRIWLLVRNASTESGYSGSVTYTMGNVSSTVADGYRRQLFSAVVHLRN